MASGRDSGLWRFSWCGLFVGLMLIGVEIFVVGYFVAGRDITTSGWTVAAAIVLMLAVAALGFGVLLLARKNVMSVNDNCERLEAIAETANKNRDVLNRIERGMRLSNTAREIVFADAERMELAEVVLAKLQQRDFDGTKKLSMR